MLWDHCSQDDPGTLNLYQPKTQIEKCKRKKIRIHRGPYLSNIFTESEGVFILVVIDLLILVPYTAIVGSNGVRVELIINKEYPSRSEGVISVIGLYNNYYFFLQL